MAIRVACLGCGHTFAVGAKPAAKQEKCPKCGSTAQIQLLDASAPSEPAPTADEPRADSVPAQGPHQPTLTQAPSESTPAPSPAEPLYHARQLGRLAPGHRADILLRGGTFFKSVAFGPRARRAPRQSGSRLEAISPRILPVPLRSRAPGP